MDYRPDCGAWDSCCLAVIGDVGRRGVTGVRREGRKMTSDLRRNAWLLGLALIAASAVLWIVLDQVAWRLRWRDGTQGSYIASLAAVSMFAAALFTMLAAVGASVYVVLTYRLWQAAAAQIVSQRRIAESGLMQSLMVEYDGMRDDIKKVRDYYTKCPADAQALDAFRNALTATDGLDGHPQEREVDRSRFRVSRFFVRLRKLSNEGYLERQIIATALSRAAIEDVFLNDIDPLD